MYIVLEQIVLTISNTKKYTVLEQILSSFFLYKEKEVFIIIKMINLVKIS